MSNDAEAIIQGELASQERLLWSGMPQQGLLLRGSDVFVIPFSVLWCGMMFAAIFHFGSERSPGPPVLLDIPFLLAGAYLLAGRFFLDAWMRSRTWYGVTDQRVIIVTRGMGRNIRTVTLRTSSEIALHERSDGRGTLTFGPASGYWGRSGNLWPGMNPRLPPKFERIEHARAVYDIIREAQGHAADRASARSGCTGLPGLDSRRV